jgi:hypothetical protein
MPSWFEGRTAAWRVTGVTVADSGGVMNPRAACEGCGGMTGGTVEIGWNMGRHGIHHTNRRITIVARNAIVGDAGMIESRRFEDARVMTDTAILVSRDMIGFLRRCKTSIVTGTAVIHDTRVTEGRRLKAGSLMTIDAISVGWHMEVVFARGGNTVVAAHTVIYDSLVFERGTGKGGGVMAQRAILGGRNMVDVHTYCRASPIGYMARRTVVDDAAMIEYGRLEAATGGVADTAILGCHNVADVHTFRRARPIGYMTGIAAHG